MGKIHQAQVLADLGLDTQQVATTNEFSGLKVIQSIQSMKWTSLIPNSAMESYKAGI
jgi:hypothetical protein